MWEVILPAVLPGLIEGGLGAVAGAQASKDKDNELKLKEKQFDAELGFKREELAERRRAEERQLLASAQGASAAAASKRAQMIQEAYQTLINAGLTGSQMGVNSLGNLITASQAPLLRTIR